MGTVYTNTLTGNTNGSIVTVDYTTDLQSISAELAFIDGNITTLNGHLSTLNTNLGTLNTSLNNAIGAGGQGTPGTVANSSVLAKDTLTVIAEALLLMQQSQAEVTDSIGQMTFAMSGLSSATQESVAVQQMALADQVSTNEFQKTATKDALARNGIDPPSPRPITEVIQEKIAEATTINATTEATTFVTDKLNKGFDYASSSATGFIAKSLEGTWIANKWAAIKTSLATDPEKVAQKTYKTGVSTAMTSIRLGTKTTPPTPPV